jgi:hypothetical protein
MSELTKWGLTEDEEDAMRELYKEKAMRLGMYYDDEAIAAVYLAGRASANAAPQENKVGTAPSDAGFKAADTCTGRGLPNEPAAAASDDYRAMVEWRGEALKLRGLLVAHNEECVRLCDNRKRCGWDGYRDYMKCPDCPKDWIIE